MEHRTYKDIYIGPLIKQKLDESGIPYAVFARQIHCARTNLYRIFNSKSIDIERLLLISDILRYDFIHEVYIPHYAPFTPDFPCIVLPLREGNVSLEHLPTELRKQIKDIVQRETCQHEHP